MKIGKLTWIILGVLVLAIGFGVVYVMYSKQLQEQDVLKAKAIQNQATLSQLVTEQEKWRGELVRVQEQIDRKNTEVTAAAASLGEAKSLWPRDAQSIDYDERLFALAQGWNLVVNVVTAGDDSSLDDQGILFNNNTFTISVTGQPLTAGYSEVSEYEDFLYERVADIIGFLDELTRDSFFATSKIDLVSLTVPSVPDQETLKTSGVDLEQPVANLTVTVYTYTGN
jgi:hypothetical protein